MGSELHSRKTLSDDRINRGLVCAHIHSIARTPKILMFMSSMGECQQQRHTQHVPSMKTECDYLNGWIKKTGHTGKNLSQTGEPQRYSWGTQKKKTWLKRMHQGKTSFAGGRRGGRGWAGTRGWGGRWARKVRKSKFFVNTHSSCHSSGVTILFNMFLILVIRSKLNILPS